jgi:hypothetical protein
LADGGGPLLGVGRVTRGYPDLLALPTRPVLLPAPLALRDTLRPVDLARVALPAWPAVQRGPHGCRTEGNKPVLLDPVQGDPVFAELFIVRALTAPGGPMTGGGWIHNYARAFRCGGCRSVERATLPASRARQLEAICAALRPLLARYGVKPSTRQMYCRGAWDVFCWRDPENLADALFVEAKGPGDRFDVDDYKEALWREAAFAASTAHGWGWTDATFKVLEYSTTVAGAW